MTTEALRTPELVRAVDAGAVSDYALEMLEKRSEVPAGGPRGFTGRLGGAARLGAAAACVLLGGCAKDAPSAAPAPASARARLEGIRPRRPNASTPRRLAVRVVDSKGLPCGGARVVVAAKYYQGAAGSGQVGAEMAAEGTTGPDGRADLDLRLSDDADGLSVAAERDAAEVGVTKWFEIDGAAPDVVLLSRPARHASAADEAGRPLEGVELRLTFGGLGAYRWIAESDARGRVVFGPAPSDAGGPVLVSYEGTRYEGTTQTMVGGEAAETPYRLTLRAPSAESKK